MKRMLAGCAACLVLVTGACDVSFRLTGLGGGTGTSAPMAPWLWFDIGPTAVPESVTIYPPVQVSFVDVQQGYNDTCTDQRITLSMTSGGSGNLHGTLTHTPVNGVATFADLWVDAPGSYSLTATAACVTNAFSQPFTVTGPIVSIAITPASLGFVVLGQMQQVTAFGRDAGGQVSGGAFIWTSSDSGKVSVWPDGTVQAVRWGSATITARRGGLTASAQVTVSRIALAALSAGGSSTCGLTTSGAAYCWGGNDYGALGIGFGDWFFHPWPMAVVGGLSFASLSVGGAHTCGVTADGAAYCWGLIGNGQLGNPAASGVCVYALPCSPTPVAVVGGLRFAAVSAGAMHTCGLAPGGAAYCWGDNMYGQLGTGSSGAPWYDSPTPVAGGLTFTSLSAGGDHTCGVTPEGKAYCWGANDGGQLGTGDSAKGRSPLLVSGGHVFASVSADYSKTCGVTTDGEVYCWGLYLSLTPLLVQGGPAFVTVATQGDHSCGVAKDGSGWCWGYNAEGQLGNGTGTDSKTPVAVTGGLAFASVTAGAYHSCGLTTSGVGCCWGGGGYGELGNGVYGAGSAVPIPIVGQGGP